MVEFVRIVLRERILERICEHVVWTFQSRRSAKDRQRRTNLAEHHGADCRHSHAASLNDTAELGGSCPERGRDRLAIALRSVFCFCSDKERHGNGPVLARRGHERERAQKPTHDRALLPGTLTSEHRTTTRFCKQSTARLTTEPNSERPTRIIQGVAPLCETMRRVFHSLR